MMPNPKCPFCGTEWSKHEAGRCLDAWVYRISNPKSISWTARCYADSDDLFGALYINNEWVASELDLSGSLRKPTRNLKTKLSWHGNTTNVFPAFSEGMNHTMTLWDDDWILHNYMEGEVLVWAIWDKVVARRSMSDGSSRHIPIAEAKDPATAICRAFLITNLKGEINDNK